jgi:sec-independent protein translocase protein TatC
MEFCGTRASFTGAEGDSSHCISFNFFFVLGAGFAFFVVLPLGLKFLLGYGVGLTPMLTVSSYVSFISRLLLVFGIVFQLPIITIFLTKVGIVTPQLLSKQRKYAILLIFIFAAILTPPDVVTQILIAFPLVGLYELSILLSKILVKRR